MCVVSVQSLSSCILIQYRPCVFLHTNKCLPPNLMSVFLIQQEQQACLGLPGKKIEPGLSDCLLKKQEEEERSPSNARNALCRGSGGGGVLGLIFVPLVSQSLYLIIVYSVGNYKPHLSHLGKYVICAIPTQAAFYLCICPILNEEYFTFQLFHLQYKHSGTFANRKYEELSYPKNQKMCASNSIENATPLQSIQF